MKLIIAANWKMHKNAADTAAFCREFRQYESLFEDVDVVIFPPFTALWQAGEELSGSSISLGAQNMNWDDEGAYTGDISAKMLSEFGVSHVIIGHSERRHIFGESDLMINMKIKKAVAEGLVPILCVGETEEQREASATDRVIAQQLKGALENVESKYIERVIIAYEPVWAIGTGKAASAEDAENAGLFIRKQLQEKFGPAIEKKIRIQYGGSVKADNIKSFVALSSIDGALVGGASLKTDSFRDLIVEARKAVNL